VLLTNCVFRQTPASGGNPAGKGEERVRGRHAEVGGSGGNGWRRSGRGHFQHGRRKAWSVKNALYTANSVSGATEARRQWAATASSARWRNARSRQWRERWNFQREGKLTVLFSTFNDKRRKRAKRWRRKSGTPSRRGRGAHLSAGLVRALCTTAARSLASDEFPVRRKFGGRGQGGNGGAGGRRDSGGPIGGAGRSERGASGTGGGDLPTSRNGSVLLGELPRSPTTAREARTRSGRVAAQPADSISRGRGRGNGWPGPAGADSAAGIANISGTHHFEKPRSLITAFGGQMAHGSQHRRCKNLSDAGASLHRSD